MPIYKSPIKPYDPIVPMPGTQNFQYLRDSFYGAGQDSYTQPFAQNQELYSSLKNLMPVTNGVLQLRYGYQLFNNPGIGAIQHLYSYQNLLAGVRKLLYVSGTAVDVSAEDGTGLASVLTSVTSNPRCVVSRDYALFTQTQAANLSVVANPHGDGQKWHSVQGLTNLGIANGPTAPTSLGPLNTGTAVTNGDGGTTAWTNPTNAQVDDGVFATNTDVGPAGPFADELKCTNFGFSVPTGAVVQGIMVEVKGKGTFTGGQTCNVHGKLIKGGVASGNDQTVGSLGASNVIIGSAGNSADLWGLSWSAADINSSTFGFLLNTRIINVAGNANSFIDTVRITVFYQGGISVSSTATAGSVTLIAGRTYAASYRNSLTGHWSDLGLFSGSTGAITAKQIAVSVPYHGDPQVDLIAILATLDGNDTTTLYVVNYIPNIPASAGSSVTYNDNMPDTTLVTQNIASELDDFGFIHGAQDNSVPFIGLNFPTKYRGRIFGANQTTLYFSKNLDEVTTSTGLVVGRFEEAWPATNTLDVSTQRESIRGLQTDGDVLYIGTERHIWRLSGDAPSNFSKPEIVFNEVGILNQDVWQIVFAEGRPLGMIWITPDRRVIMSNFGNYEDIGTPIQDLLNTINPAANSTAWGGFFSEGAYDIYILAIPTGSNTTPDTFCVLDLRSQRWSVWTPTDLFSTGMFNINASGAPQWLMASSTGKVYQFISTATQDRVSDTPVAIIPSIQTPWMHLGSPTMVKSLNEIEVITGDTSMTVTVDGASTYAQTSSPNNVVTSGVLVNSPRGFKKLYLAGQTAKDRFYRFTFTGTGSSQNVLEGYTIEAVPIPY